MIYKTLTKKKIVAPVEKAIKWNLDLNIQEELGLYVKQLAIGRTCIVDNKL